MIPAITAWSRNFERLYNRWASTLPEQFKIYDKIIDIPADGYGFQKQSWYNAIALKIAHFIHTLEQLPVGQIALCCDCDIFFIDRSSKLADYITSKIKTENQDMLFMREAMSQEVNGGFIVVRNSLDVQNIFKTAMEYCKLKTPHADQDYFNSTEFKQLNIHWDFIDYNLVAWGNNIYNPKKTLFHHAVCASGLEEKLKQQDRIATRLEKSYTI